MERIIPRIVLAFLVLGWSFNARATVIWDEAVEGDRVGSYPAIVLQAGSNIIRGTQSTSCAFDPLCIPSFYNDHDTDHFLFYVPKGYKLTSLQYSLSDPILPPGYSSIISVDFGVSVFSVSTSQLDPAFAFNSHYCADSTLSVIQCFEYDPVLDFVGSASKDLSYGGDIEYEDRWLKFNIGPQDGGSTYADIEYEFNFKLKPITPVDEPWPLLLILTNLIAWASWAKFARNRPYR